MPGRPLLSVKVEQLVVFQLIPAGANAPCCGCCPQESYLITLLGGEVEQLFLQYAFNAVPPSVDLS